MAKKGRRNRKFRRYIRGQVDESSLGGTLAALTVVSTVFDETVNERTFVSSLKAAWSLDNWTPTSGAGPVLVGVAHSDYTDAEIEAFIETTGSWNETDQIAQEVGKRKIRVVGIFKGPADALTFEHLNDGNQFTTKLGWILTQGQTLRLWQYNMGASAYATTNPNVRIEGHANLWPQ